MDGVARGVRWVGAASVVALGGLSACGGGGGGGDGNSPAAPSLSLANVRAAAIDQEVFEGADGIQSVTVTADLSGNLAALDGKTVFVVVEDPAGLFSPAANVALGANGLNNSITLVGRSSNSTTGDFQGNIRVNVCLDARCAQPLGGSPVVVPYRVKVLPGLKFAQGGTLNLAATFPDGAPATTTNIVLPQGATTFRTTLQTDFTNLVDGQLLATTATSGSAVTVTGRPAPPKSYVFGLSATASGVTSKGRVVELTATRQIAYTVTGPTTLDVRYSPDPLNLTVAQGTITPSAEVLVQTFASTGTVYAFPRRIDYLPAGDGGRLDAQGVSWLSITGNTGRSFVNFFGGQIGLQYTGCGTTTLPPFETRCLAPGRYEAMVYPADNAQRDSPVPVRVTLTVQAR